MKRQHGGCKFCVVLAVWVTAIFLGGPVMADVSSSQGINYLAPERKLYRVGGGGKDNLKILFNPHPELRRPEKGIKDFPFRHYLYGTLKSEAPDICAYFSVVESCFLKTVCCTEAYGMTSMEDLGSLIIRRIAYEVSGDDAVVVENFSSPDETDSFPVPKPTTMFLFGAGLLWVAVTRRKFRKE